MRYFIILALISAPMPAQQQASTELQCRDANGNPLDWFVMLKEPNGSKYAYVSSSVPNSWTQGANLEDSGPLYRTVSPVLSAADADVLAAYNDEPPDDKGGGGGFGFAHMKGVVALTVGRLGFWLIHSVPHFPNFSQPHYTYPKTGLMYGQSFLCITLNSSLVAEAIATQLFTSHPDFYQLRVSFAAQTNWPTWTNLTSRRKPPAHLLNTTAHLVTAAGLKVVHVAKSPNLKNDFYSYLLTSQLGSSIQAETWQHGTGLLNSTCKGAYNVTKVLQVRVLGMPSFRSTSDHSKWCVGSSKNAPPYVCIGDMNRATTQFTRGGGTACLTVPSLHSMFKAAVVEEQPCDRAEPTTDEYLAHLLYWVMVGVLCFVICTIAAVLLISRLAVRISRSGQRYQEII